jgi:heptosyltransferase II
MIREVAPGRRWAARIASVMSALVLGPLLLLNRARRWSADPTRILVLELWGIGDVVLATGAIRSLRAAYPHARITLLAKSYAATLAVGPEMASEVIAYDFPWTAFSAKYRPSRYRLPELIALIRRLRGDRYDLILNARADIRNNVLGALVGGARFVSVACGAGDFLATDVVAVTQASHRSEDWATVAERAVGAGYVAKPPRLTVGPDERAARAGALGIAHRDGRPLIGIHPGAAAAVRRWGLDKFARVANAIVDRTGAGIVVFAEPDGYGADIALRATPIVVRGSLREAMVALSLCDLVICSDSGLMHIAAALGVPVVALFGPGQSQWFGPRGAASRIVQIDDMPCRPCFDACRFAEPYCMTRLPESAVIEGALELIAMEQASGVSSTPGAPATAVGSGTEKW